MKKILTDAFKLRKIRTLIRLKIHSGNKFICPICGYKSNGFAAIGKDLEVLKEKKVVGGGRRNAGCYKCSSTDRERLIFLYLKHKINIFKSKEISILHLAPEKNLSVILNGFGFNNYVCGDLFAEGYEYPSFVQNMNVLDLPFKAETFDVVICNHLLEHVIEDLDAMRQIYEVLKFGGIAILQVPFSLNSDQTYEDPSITDSKEREKHFGQFDHVRIYGLDYFDRLKSVGFGIKRLNIFNEFSGNGLCKDEDIFLGTK